MKAVRRVGTTPSQRGDTGGVTGSPDILELDDGTFAVIGEDITEQLGRTPLHDARCGPNERIVMITRRTLVDAKPSIPDA